MMKKRWEAEDVLRGALCKTAIRFDDLWYNAGVCVCVSERRLEEGPSLEVIAKATRGSLVLNILNAIHYQMRFPIRFLRGSFEY